MAALLLSLAVALACASGSLAATVPAFVLSDSAVADSKGGVVYETLSTKELSRRLFRDLTSSDPSQEPTFISFSGEQNPQLLLAIVSDVLRTEHITVYGSNSAQAFQKLISSAKSSVSVPYIDLELSPTKMSSALLNSFKEFSPLGNVAVLGSCKLDNSEVKQLNSVDEIEDHLNALEASHANAKINLLMFCASEKPSPLNTLAGENEQIEEVVSVVKAHSPNSITLLASDAPNFHHIQSSNQRRIMKLKSASGINTTLCDTSCQFKADILEGALVLIVLLIILISGLCCMAGIESPTKFEVSKEA